MRYCQACGAQRTGTSRFCEQCGEAFPLGDGESRGKGLPWGRLGWAGPLPILFFLLPWITVSCQTMPVSQSFTGLTLATGFTVQGPFGGAQRVPGEPVLFLVPLAAALVAILFWLGLRGRVADTTAMLGGAIGAAALGLAVMGFKYVQWSSQLQRETGGMVYLSPAIGSILSLVAFVAAGTGAWLELVESRRRPAPISSRIVAPSAGGAGVEHAVTAAVMRNGKVALPYEFCTECGARIQSASRFCVECGHRLDVVYTFSADRGGDGALELRVLDFALSADAA